MLLACVLLFLGLTIRSQARSGFYTLSSPATTSAGVFAADGSLVRTLWSGDFKAAGTHPVSWDGTDEFGQPFTGPVTVKILAHNVAWSWEGVVGNSSKSQTGPDKLRSFEAVWSMAFAPDGRGFSAVGYNEQQFPFFRFHQNDYQARLPMAHDDYQRSFSIVAADAQRVYFANTGSGFNSVNFIIALNLSDSSYPEHAFANGAIESPGQPGQRWESVIDRGSSVITGLAVQRNGNLLFVAHRDENLVKVFDKVSGAQLRTISITSPEGLATAPNGDLWVIGKVAGLPVVVRYTATDSANPVLATTLLGLESPLAIAVSPDGGTVVVADGGLHQQLRAFNTAGVPLWTLGQLGGYDLNGPDVANNKFLFRDRTYWRARAYLAYSPDGRLWVGDVGNERTLIFDGQRNFQDQIMYLPHNYTVAVDPNDPGRVFNYWLEFAVDYTKPIGQGWRLVKNWSAGLAQNRFSGFGEGLVNVVTLTHGSTRRTFAFVPDFSTYGPDKFVVMELPASGKLRETGQRFSESRAIYPDHSLRYYDNSGGAQRVWSRPFTGFDVLGNPGWGSSTVLASAPTGATDPHYRGAFSSTSGPRFPSTQSGMVLFFDQQKKTPDYRGWHLGGVQAGAGTWKFRASPSGRFRKNCDEDMTQFPAVHRPCWYQEGEIVLPDGSYDVADARTEYGGNRVMAAGPHVVYGYHGEFWNSGQANQWLHFHESGLFISQFGKANYPMPNRDAALAGAAGNAFSPALVNVNGQVYLWHNDESAHAGVHRWKMEGASSIQLISVSLSGEGNVPPTVAITSPASGASFPAPGSITIVAFATDANGGIKRVEFFANDEKLGTDFTAPFELTWNNVPAGAYSLTARAVDTDEVAVESAPVNVMVSSAAPSLRHFVNQLGQPVISVLSTIGETCVVEQSFNLQTWTPVSTNTSLAPSWEFLPALGTNASVFYRVRRF